jgi:hypothetical protein
MRYAAGILALGAIISPLGLRRAQAPVAELRSVWDGVYTEEQAKRGEAANNRDRGHARPGRSAFVADCRQLPAPGEQQQQARNGKQR